MGGIAGDWLFKRTLKGRIIVSSAGVILGAIFLLLAMNTPIEIQDAILYLYVSDSVVYAILFPECDCDCD